MPEWVRNFSFGSKKSAHEPYPGTWEVVGGAQDAINERNLLEANREWVYIAADRIATSVAGVRFKVMKFARSGDDQEVFAGPLVDFLEKPGENFTGKDFIYLNTVWKELTGNAFWEKDGKLLSPLVPTRITAIVNAGQLAGYKYMDGTSQRTLALDDVLHDFYADPAKPWWGAGKLQKIARWADSSGYITEFLSRFFANGATFGGFITTEEESEQRINLIKIGLANDHSGVRNAHKLGVLPKGSDFKPTGVSMSDMEMGDTDDRYRDKILAGFGVPKTLVGLTTEVNKASAEAAEYVYAKYTLKPVVDDLIEFLNTAIAPLFDATGTTYFTYDDFIPEDVGNKVLERQAALANQPYMTVNEVRAQLGLPPVPGGDEVQRLANANPLGTPQPTPAAPAADPADPKKGFEAGARALPPRARAAFGKESMVEDILAKAAEVATAHHDPDAEAHKSFVGRVEAHQDLIEGKVRDFNNRQQRDVNQRLKQITKAVKKGDVFDMDGEVGVLIDFVTPLLKGLLIEQAIEEFTAQKFPGTLDQNAPTINTIIAAAAKRLAKSYNDTTADLITSTLNEGIKAGEDLTQLTDRVNAVYDYSDQVRAKQVANTEAFYIANKGSKEAYRQSGVVTELRWYTAEDEQVCEFCGPEDGQIVGVDDNFYDKGETITGSKGGTLDLDYRAIDVPPLHPNCRCFVRPETIDAG